MAGKRPKDKHANNSVRTTGNAPKAKATSTPGWLSAELIVAAGNDGNMFNKMRDAVNTDSTLFDKIKYGATHHCKQLMQQLRDKVVAGRKSERS